jgi:ribose transport system permease protein
VFVTADQMKLCGNRMGLSVNRVKVWGVRSHGCVQHAGRSIVTARLDSAQPNTGLGYEMDDIAAVVMGGRHSRVARGHLGHGSWVPD